jgi:flagellin
MDGQALIDTAEGAHIEITDILQRMRELAVQAANDTNDANDRNNIEKEYTSLVTEIDRISEVTTWAGKSLLNGSGSGTGNASFAFQVGSKTNSADSVTATIGAMRASVLDIAATYAGTTSDSTASATSATGTGLSITSNNAATTKLTVGSDATSANATYSVKIDGNAVTYSAAATDVASTIGTKLASGINALSGFTASSTGGVVSITKTTAVTTSTTTVSLDSMTAAQSMIGKIDTALQTVADQRATLGALSNRLDNTVSNLTNVSNNLAAGKGRIEDADFAAETTNLAKTQILQQASTAMLAQANASKQNVLSLLQG